MKHTAHSIFRSISFLDVLLVIGVTLVVLVFYLVFKRDVAFVTARFKVTDDNALYANNLPGNEYASSFMAGDTEKDELGKTVSEIVGVESYKITPDRTVVYLDIKMKAVYNPRKKQYTLRGKTLSFGESFTFSFSKVKFKALVIDFPGFRDSKTVTIKKIVVRAQLRDPSRYFADTYGVPWYLAQSIKKGDVMKDSKENILLKIVEVFTAPAKRTIINNQAYQTSDPELQDVFYTIELSARSINGQNYMLDYLPILVGAIIPINLPTVSVFPTITEIL